MLGGLKVRSYRANMGRAERLCLFYRIYLKNNLSGHGGVVKRFKMLTYYV